MIVPTVGRVVNFRPGPNSVGPYLFSVYDHKQPCTAQIVFVHSDKSVNLSVFDHAGAQHTFPSVDLIQPGEPKPDDRAYCYWMEYQVGQAAKTEELEKKIQEKHPAPTMMFAPPEHLR